VLAAGLVEGTIGVLLISGLLTRVVILAMWVPFNLGIPFLASQSRVAQPRQQTLSATIDWSYVLLDETQQRVFERLSVLANGWTMDAAVAICADNSVAAEVVLVAVLQLVRTSLVVRSVGAACSAAQSTHRSGGDIVGRLGGVRGQRLHRAAKAVVVEAGANRVSIRGQAVQFGWIERVGDGLRGQNRGLGVPAVSTVEAK
jgi:hypothetical protein